MRRMGLQIEVIPQPINFFTNSAVLDDGTLVSPPNPVPPELMWSFARSWI
jgi:hypothetical protein